MSELTYDTYPYPGSTTTWIASTSTFTELFTSLHSSTNSINDQIHSVVSAIESQVTFSGTEDDFDPGSATQLVHQSGTATVTGFEAPSGTQNQRLWIANTSNDIVTFSNDDSGSLSTHRLHIGADITSRGDVLFLYSSLQSHWRCMMVRG